METKKLVLFLKNLANSVEQDSLDNKQLANVSEFYMSWKFKRNTGEYSSQELIKYLSLGWYIYTYLLNENIGN